MAQSTQAPTAMMNQPRLFPVFPNEIGDLILLQLSFFDLITAYFVSKPWRNFLEDNEDIRRSMFRLPKRFDNVDEQTCIDFINELWGEIDDEDDYDYVSPARRWSNVAINPIFCGPIAKGTFAHAPAYAIDVQEDFDFSRLPTVRRCSWNRLRNLWDSMFVTYPPVTRIQIEKNYVPRTWSTMIVLRPDCTELLRPGGVMVRDLWNAITRPEDSLRRQRVLPMYPERLFPDDSDEDEEEEEEEEEEK